MSGGAIERTFVFCKKPLPDRTFMSGLRGQKAGVSANSSTFADPSTPPQPGPPYFDSARNTWVLSRYVDVWAALRHPHLWPVNGKREIQPETRDEVGRLKQRAEMLEALQQLDRWRPTLQALTHNALRRLPVDRAVDLLAEFTLPWGLDLALLVTCADPASRGRLSELGVRVFAATGEDLDAAVRADAAAATAELERIFTSGPIPMGEPAFVALSQTLPRLLANAWLALIRHPGEYSHLREHPELMPGAVEELLRYAGIVRRVFRRSTAPVELGGTHIAEGELAVLMLASANRDPEQFPDPDRLILSRPASGHFALGTGRNSCVGAMLIRMAAAVATGALVNRFAEAHFERVGEWRLGSGFCFPASVYVTLRPS
jgi:cytochrome P450